jgi:hypothetical protein
MALAESVPRRVAALAALRLVAEAGAPLGEAGAPSSVAAEAVLP